MPFSLTHMTKACFAYVTLHAYFPQSMFQDYPWVAVSIS